MPAFQLTARYNQNLNDGMRIEKGQTFIVNVPWAHLPFDSIQSKDLVKRRLALEGFDIKGHEYSILSSSFFDFKQI